MSRTAPRGRGEDVEMRDLQGQVADTAFVNDLGHQVHDFIARNNTARDAVLARNARVARRYRILRKGELESMSRGH